jgi:hypothetical protein
MPGYVDVMAVGCALMLFAGAAFIAGGTLETHLGKGYDALKQERYDVAVSEVVALLQ